MEFTPAQHDAVHLPYTLVVTAGAGSGKTRVLVERAVRLLLASVSSLPTNHADTIPGILAITFTDKAAREMRERVRAAVEARAQAAASLAERALWEDVRSAVEGARIGTIHSFCMELLRAQPAESGLDPQFVVLDEVEAAWLVQESVQAALSEAAAGEQATAAHTPDVRGLLEAFGLNELRAMLIEMLQGGPEVQSVVSSLPAQPADLLTLWREQLAVAQARASCELVGSETWRGASETLRLLAAVAPAADRIGGQVVALGDWLQQVASAASPAAGQPAVPDFGPVQAINLQGGSKKQWADAADLASAKEALKALREACRSYADILALVPDAALEQRAASATVALGALYRRALAHYTRRKEQRDALDYDDLEQRARLLLEAHPPVRARWRAEFQAVLVDEFQDTNDEQRAIISALTGLNEPADATGAAGAAERPGLFVVGDGKQSIYRFRGADVQVFREVAADVQQQGGQIVALDTSFRSHPLLLAWINRVAQSIFARDRTLRPYEVPFEPLQSYRAAPDHSRCIELHSIESTSTISDARTLEARIIAERIRALKEGQAGAIVYDSVKGGWRCADYGDVAILCQASTVFEYYEQALRAAGIPYLTTAGRGYYGRKEVQDLVHLLRVLNDPADELALVGVLRSPLFALDDATILRLRFAHARSLWSALMQPGDEQQETGAGTDAGQADTAPALAFARDTLRELYRLRGRLTVVELLRTALATTGYLATISGLEDGARRRVNIEKLLEAARRAGTTGLLAFSEYLENLLSVEPREGEAPLEAEGSVRLMTVHKSKGLEFPIVVLPDLGRGSLARRETWLARRAYGLALRLRDQRGETQLSSVCQLARYEERLMEQAERDRLLYVALTRASDYLILSGPAASRSSDSWLARLLAVPGMPWQNGGMLAGDYGAMQIWQH